MMRAAWAPLIAVLLTGCAHYAPVPLTVAASSLTPPVEAALQQRADTMTRPWLHPLTIDLAQPLDANAVAVLAVINNPDLKAMRARIGVAEAQSFAAGLLPDPTVSIGANRVLSGPDMLLDFANALALNINALRTRGVTRDRALAEARQVRLDMAWAEWQTAGQARIQAVRVNSLGASAVLARQSRDDATWLFETTQRAAGRGDLAGSELETTRLAVLDASERLRSAERDLAAARGELNTLLGLPPETDLRIADPAIATVVPQATELFALAGANRADLHALEAGYAAQEAAVHKAILDQFPTLDLTVNANRDSAGNLLLGPAIGFTLPLWNRNRGGIAIEQATREALRAEYDARLFKTRADIAAAIGALNLALRQRAEQTAALPQIERYARATQRAATRGDLALTTARTAAQALRDRQSLLAQSERDAREADIALELLTGTPREAWAR